MLALAPEEQPVIKCLYTRLLCAGPKYCNGAPESWSAARWIVSGAQSPAEVSAHTPPWCTPTTSCVLRPHTCPHVLAPYLSAPHVRFPFTFAPMGAMRDLYSSPLGPPF